MAYTRGSSTLNRIELHIADGKNSIEASLIWDGAVTRYPKDFTMSVEDAAASLAAEYPGVDIIDCTEDENAEE